MRVAIVGAGISGLGAAYRLHRHHEITVFEAGAYAGGHTNTIRVDLEDESHDVDTGFIVFNERYYPGFISMLADLGVESRPTSMSFSVRCDRTSTEWNGSSWNGIFAQRRNLVRPSFLRMLAEIRRFYREAATILEDDREDTSVEEYLRDHGYSESFASLFLLPLGAALWSTPLRGFRRFPIRFVVDFFANHDLLQWKGRPTWRVVRGGSRTYVDRLLARFGDRVRLSTPVRSVSRGADGVDLRTDATGTERFDHVILACHADQALMMLEDPTDAESEVLSAFPYQRNEAILHTDTSVLPRRRRAWGSWNYHVRRDDAERATVTYDMTRLQSLPSRRTFCVTLNDDAGIDPAKIIRRIDYAHPVYTRGRRAAQRRHAELCGPNRTSYAGAYWGYGFHEDGLQSGWRAADAVPAGAPA
jgi:predicted NAD/FAD-binding protein